MTQPPFHPQHPGMPPPQGPGPQSGFPHTASRPPDPDGSRLLTTDEVEPLLRAAVQHAGGTLVRWQMSHVDSQPNRSTTATYTAVVDGPQGRREELLGVSTRAGGRSATDEHARIFVDGEREAAVWIYPHDPDLPGLPRAAFPESAAALLGPIVGSHLHPGQVELRMIGYRPRRRAVVRARVTVPGPRGTQRIVFYTKVLRDKSFHDVRHRHEMLLSAGIPAPRVAAATPDCLLVLDELPGTPLSRAIFDPRDPCTAEDLIGVLDAMPPSVAQLPRRAPWAESIHYYTDMVAQAMPTMEPRLRWLANEIENGLASIPLGNEPTHGDFHEGQIHVRGGRICGLLDVDTIGPGRRADDLACMVAHLSTVQRMNAQQAARVRHLLSTWVPVFDERVDPAELRLRAAAVVISLATGPYRSQEPNWQAETNDIVDAAETLVSQVL